MKAVIDSGIVMNTNLLPDIKAEIYIPQSILAEIQSSQAKHIFDLFLSHNKIDVVEPQTIYEDKIRAVASEMGQADLSPTDIDVLAIALELVQHDEVVVYTDDYGIRNVSHQLNIPSTGITTQGGQELREYGYRCRGCGSIYLHLVQECDICGHEQFSRFRRT